MKFLCFQYSLINILISIALVIVIANSYIGGEPSEKHFVNVNFSPYNFKVLLKLLRAVLLGSVFIAIYGLILYLDNFREGIKHYKPNWKFFSIKIALFLSIWQKTILKWINVDELIELDHHVKSNLTSGVYIDDFLVTVEMFVLSLVALKYFSYSDFVQGDHKNVAIKGKNNTGMIKEIRRIV